MKILVADDDRATRMVLHTALLKWNYECCEAQDGTTALAMIEADNDIKFAILDWEMPGLEGTEICRRLRKNEITPYLLLLTGKNNDRDVAEGLEAGANDYLTKPFSPEMLRLRVLVAERFIEMHATLSRRVAELSVEIVVRKEVDSLLKAMMESREGVSDLLFLSGKYPQVEAFGKLKSTEVKGWDRELTPERIMQLATHFINDNERLLSDFNRFGSCDCSYAINKSDRFRVNIYRQNGEPAIVMRKLKSDVPSLDELNLTPIFNKIIEEKNGIVFVTGSTGSGKTTTLAAMLNELNRTEEIHIVTLEDPIEFLHPKLKASFSQRQLGLDFQEFSLGLRAALRQAPKVILVAEIRDRATMEAAMIASETGHLVFSTLNTENAAQSIQRILGMFTKEEEPQIRRKLAETLRYIVSQRLIAKIGGGRMMVSEIMGTSQRVREAVLYGEQEGRSFLEIIEAAEKMGWQSFDQSLLSAYEAGQISEESAMLYCNSKSSMSHRLDRSKQRRGIDTPGDTGFRLEHSPFKSRTSPLGGPSFTTKAA